MAEGRPVSAAVCGSMICFNGAPDWNPGKGVASEGVVYRWSKGFNGAPDWNPGKADWKDKRGKGKILFQWSPRLESGERWDAPFGVLVALGVFQWSPRLESGEGGAAGYGAHKAMEFQWSPRLESGEGPGLPPCQNQALRPVSMEPQIGIRGRRGEKLVGLLWYL